MTEILGAATSATKGLFGFDGATIDNLTFQLFYKATTTLLMLFAAITSSKQFFGEPIACDVVNKIF